MSESTDVQQSIDDALVNLVQTRGYSCIKHKVTTQDGYVLHLFNIQRDKEQNHSNNNKQRNIVFLQHGLFNSCATWCLSSNNDALAFTLADNGYDVWLGNNRGTIFGREHIKYNPDEDSEFWKFSWHEMGMYDLPAQIDHVLKETKVSSVTYIGHSQGCTQALVAMSQIPAIQKKINRFVGLAPVSRLENQTSTALSGLAAMRTDSLLSILGIGEINVSSSKTIMGTLSPTANLGFANKIWGLLLDSSMHADTVKILSTHEPSSTSSQNLGHWTQIVRTGHFQSYDHGKEINLEKYNSEKPIRYDIQKIKVPCAIFYGQKDFLANVVDVEHFLLKLLPNVTMRLKLSNYRHNDFVWANEANNDLHCHILGEISGEYTRRKVEFILKLLITLAFSTLLLLIISAIQ
jgi:lysosomal acid lipase/cholesteryl ester hydrolase